MSIMPLSENSLVMPVALTLVLSIVFFMLNLRFFQDGHLTIMIWMAAGVPILVVFLAIVAASSSPPRSYAAIAGLVGIANGMVGLGIRIVGFRLRQRGR